MKKRGTVVAKAKKAKKKIASKPAKKKKAAQPARGAKKKTAAPRSAQKSGKKASGRTAGKTASKTAKKTVKKTARPAASKAKVLRGGASSGAARASRDLSAIISPLDDRVLVRLASREKVTAGGLIIPDTADVSGHLKGDVVAIGRGHRDPKGHLRPIELRVGDRILINEYSGAKVTVGEEELLILRESEVLGVVET